MMKPPDAPPSWYCDFKIPTNILPMFQPLVYLIGLQVENNQVHRSFWELLNMHNSGRDFQPKYVNVLLDNKFRDKKTKLPESMEYYIPRGILKSNWIHKHTEEIPSVVVTFFDMNWSDPQWNERKLDLAKQIKFVKNNFASHGIQILVMLMKPAGTMEDYFTTERASAFCAATEIPPKHLFVLAHTNVERIQASAQRLEVGMREISKTYYSMRIKKVKGWKDKVTATPLLVRYNFKIAVFQDIRKDFIAALTHYQSALEALLTIKATDANIQELKVVASILTYRICRLHLNKDDGKESKNQFDKLMRSFLKTEGNKELLFEHYAWLSQQYYQFGDLLKQYYRGGNSNIPDPISYFIAAGKYAEKRRDAFCQTLTTGKHSWPAEMNPYNGSVQVKLCCIGQRPWWNNPFSQDYLYATEDSNTVQALKYFESLCKHSDYIISDWGIASEVCRESQRVRCRCQLMSMMGAEFLRSKQYSKCIMLMTHVLRELGQEDWKNIVYDVANCGVTAAYAAGDVPAYCNFLLILLKLDIVDLVSKEKHDLLWSNFQRVMDGDVPLPVDSNSNFDLESWRKGLSEPEWTSYVEIHSQPILDCKTFFIEDVASIADTAKIRFILTNKSDFTLKVRKFGVRMNPIDYNCESITDITIHPQECQELELILKPLVRDISKLVQIQVAYLDIGRPNRSVLLHYSVLNTSNAYLWSNEISGSKRGGYSVRIEQSKPLIKIETSCPNSVLVNEWCKVTITVTNTDNRNYEKIAVACQLQTPDPQNAVLSPDPDSNIPPTTLHLSDISKLAATQNYEIVVYLKALVSIESEFKLSTKIKYVDHYSQLLTVEDFTELQVIPPFEIFQSITNLHNVEMDSISINEDFMIQSTITNISKNILRVMNATFNITSPRFDLKHQACKNNSNIVLNPNEDATYAIILSCSEVGTTSPGDLTLLWKRQPEEVGSETEFQQPLVGVTVLIDKSLYLKAMFSNNGHGKLKQPMIGYYTLVNRSNIVFDLTLSMDSTESFMNAGPKRLSVKLYGRESYNFNYILFPLVTGLVETPKLSFCIPANGSTILEAVELPIHLNGPKNLFVTA